MKKVLLLITMSLVAFSSVFAQESVLFYPTLRYLKGSNGATPVTIIGNAPETEKIWTRGNKISESLIDYTRPAATDDYKYVAITALESNGTTVTETESWLVLDQVNLQNAIGAVNLDYYYSIRSADKSGGQSRVQILATTDFSGDVNSANIQAATWTDITPAEYKQIDNTVDPKIEYYRHTIELAPFVGKNVRIAVKYTCDYTGTKADNGSPLMFRIGDIRVTEQVDYSGFTSSLSVDFEDDSYGTVAGADFGGAYVDGYQIGPVGSEFEKHAINQVADLNQQNFYVFQSNSTKEFEAGKFGIDNRYVRLTGKNANLNRVAWFISPELDLTNVSNAYMEFKNSVRYGTFANYNIELLVIEGYTGYDGDGDPADQITATHNITSRVTWGETNKGYYYTPEWTNSGKVNLSDFAGKKVRFAFRTNFSDATATNLLLDDINVSTKKSTSTAVGDDKKQAQWTIYPNPVVSQFNISGTERINRVEVYSILGNKVADLTVTAQDGVDASTLAPGLYVVKLHGERGTVEFQKILKK
ncbi:choice-of-anchor J domain-containing protein [Halosquirtibacter xylanolyticus]|uniref:choice-of-anchor J domain-containing protein n=1 Tax=Halosquirtibacter xylanolyticus TaxID=3374599 RepID=UPI00374A46A0|nr:choice-of-anchor J domain-containing protein [Prolixibacteraceae bacterium]